MTAMSKQLVTSGNGGPPDQPDVSDIMTAALAPYRVLDDWGPARCAVFEARGLLERENGKLTVLERTTDPEQRWQLHLRAYGALEAMPPNDQLIAAHKAVRMAIQTEPTARERKLMVGLMLDGFAIKNDATIDGYISTVSYILADTPPDDVERSAASLKPPRWIPLPAIADAIKRMWLKYRADYGRPPPIPMLLEELTASRAELARTRNQIAEIGIARKALNEIAAATEDSYSPEDWE
jgi:hypothetical protein